MDQGGVRMIGLRKPGGRPATAPRLGDTPKDPPGIYDVPLMKRQTLPPPEKVLVVARDSVRQIRCRSAPAPPGVILSQSQLQAIKDAAAQVSEESRLKQLQKAREAARAALEEKEKRRILHDQMEARYRRRRYQEDLKSLQMWPPGKAEEKDVLKDDDRRSRQELEREEEVKELRRLVLAAKCHAIREAQVLEKRHIRQLEKEEEERQAAEMEAARLRGLREEAERERAKQEATKLAADALNKQIEYQEELKQLKFKEKKKEAQAVAREIVKYKNEQADEVRKKEEKKKKDKVAAKRVMELAGIRREEELKLSKLRDAKVVLEAEERQKAIAARLEEEAMVKQTKEDLLALWLHDQERKLLEKKKREELKTMREQEKLEREWRERELEEAKQKAERDAKITKERRQQIEDRQKARMAEALKKKEELLRKTDHWMITEERERTTIQKAQKAKEDYEARIKAQIEEHAERRAKEAEMLKREKEEEILQVKLRQAALTRLKLDTLKDLRKMALPDHLVKDLEKKLHLKKQENDMKRRRVKTSTN